MIFQDCAENVADAVLCYKDAMTVRTRAGDASRWPTAMFSLMRVQHYAGNASAALEVMGELHAALDDVQS